MPMTYVSVPRRAAGEVIKRDIVEVSEELAEKELGRWERHAKNPRSKANPTGSLPGNIHWKTVRYATEEELIAAKIIKAPKKKGSKKNEGEGEGDENEKGGAE